MEPGSAPILIKTKAKRIPSWQLYNDMTGPIPYSITYGLETAQEDDITLIPYGCTNLRISQFSSCWRPVGLLADNTDF